jgi:hypothetical protein
MAKVELSLEEYEALRSMAHDNSCIGCSGKVSQASPVSQDKPKRKANAYNKKYAAAFKKVKGKFMKKNGGWKKDGFKFANRAAHKLAKK